MTRPTSRCRANNTVYRLKRLEALEDRTLLSATVFDAIAEEVTAPSGQLDMVGQQLAATAPGLIVPVVRAPLTAAADMLEQAREALHGAMANLSGLGDDVTELDVRTEIAVALNDAALLGDRDDNGVTDAADVDLQVFDPIQGLIDVQLNLHRDVATATPEMVGFDIGLPALPFYLLDPLDNVAASFGIDYTDFHFGIDGDGTFLDLGNPGDGPDLTLSVAAGLSDDFALEGAIGFFHGSITAAEDPTSLNAQIDIDLIEGQAPTFAVSGSAAVNLQFQAEVITAGNVSFPVSGTKPASCVDSVQALASRWAGRKRCLKSVARAGR